MSFPGAGYNAFYDELCRYGGSAQMCRGPKRALDAPYLAFLGTSETFGKFALRPFADILEDITARDCVNLGCGDLGLDALLADEDLLTIAQGADQVVIQVMPASHLSNPFYRVHPRRNDRFLEPTPALRDLYPEVDFSYFHFTRHVLADLEKECPTRFRAIADALQTLWQEKMTALTARFSPAPTLLWLQYDSPRMVGRKLGPHRDFVTQGMMDTLRSGLAGVIEIAVKPASFSGEVTKMDAGPLSAPAAAQMIGQSTHFEIAEILQRSLNLPHQMKKPA